MLQTFCRILELNRRTIGRRMINLSIKGFRPQVSLRKQKIHHLLHIRYLESVTRMISIYSIYLTSIIGRHIGRIKSQTENIVSIQLPDLFSLNHKQAITGYSKQFLS